jgi:FkbM family methyltransferase
MADDQSVRGELGAVDDGALMDEVARRLDNEDSNSTELIGRLVDGVDAKVAGHLFEDLAPQRELDYSGESISLVVRSPAVARRLRSVEKEPFTVAYIEDNLKPGDVFYDIGANVGPYALIASKATSGRAQVVAFEPSPASFADLARNIELNGCSESVTPLPLTLWSETGLVPVTWRSQRSGVARHRIGEWSEDATSGPVTMGMTLDDAVESLGIPSPTHAKIDVDGYEVELLRGAHKTLADPGWRSIIIELDRKETERNREIQALVAAGGFDQGLLQERTSSKRYPDPARRPDVYWVFTRPGTPSSPATG